MTNGVLDAGYAEGRARPSEAHFRYRVRAQTVADVLRSRLAPRSPAHLLDFGSAEGRGLLELRKLMKRDTNFTGIEASSSLLSAAPALPPEITLLKGDVTRLPDSVESESFDAVTALAVLEHLPRPLEAVREAARALRPGGIFIASCPHPRWDHVATWSGLLADDQHESELGRAELSSLPASAGLELLEYRRFMFAPVGILPYARIPVPPRLSVTLDRLVGALRVFNGLFVNQLLVARKPA